MIAYCGWKVICELKLKKKNMKTGKGREMGLFIRGIPDRSLSVPRMSHLERQSVPMGTLREHSRNTPGTLREHSGNTQGTLREHSRNTQGTLQEHSSNTPGTLREHSRNTPGTLKEHSGNTHGTLGERSCCSGLILTYLIHVHWYCNACCTLFVSISNRPNSINQKQDFTIRS